MACPSMHELQAQLQSLQAMYASIPTPSDSRHKRRQGRSSLVASKHVNNLDCGAVGGDSQEQNQKQKTPQVSLELSREHSSQTSFSQGCARETGGSSSDQQRACAVPSVSKGTEVRTCRVREDGGGRKRRVRKQTKQASKQWAHDFGGGVVLSHQPVYTGAKHGASKAILPASGRYTADVAELFRARRITPNATSSSGTGQLLQDQSVDRAAWLYVEVHNPCDSTSVSPRDTAKTEPLPASSKAHEPPSSSHTCPLQQCRPHQVHSPQELALIDADTFSPASPGPAVNPFCQRRVTCANTSSPRASSRVEALSASCPEDHQCGVEQAQPQQFKKATNARQVRLSVEFEPLHWHDMRTRSASAEPLAAVLVQPLRLRSLSEGHASGWSTDGAKAGCASGRAELVSVTRDIVEQQRDTRQHLLCSDIDGTNASTDVQSMCELGKTAPAHGANLRHTLKSSAPEEQGLAAMQDMMVGSPCSTISTLTEQESHIAKAPSSDPRSAYRHQHREWLHQAASNGCAEIARAALAGMHPVELRGSHAEPWQAARVHEIVGLMAPAPLSPVHESLVRPSESSAPVDEQLQASSTDHGSARLARLPRRLRRKQWDQVLEPEHFHMEQLQREGQHLGTALPLIAHCPSQRATFAPLQPARPHLYQSSSSGRSGSHTRETPPWWHVDTGSREQASGGHESASLAGIRLPRMTRVPCLRLDPLATSSQLPQAADLSPYAHVQRQPPGRRAALQALKASRNNERMSRLWSTGHASVCSRAPSTTGHLAASSSELGTVLAHRVRVFSEQRDHVSAHDDDSFEEASVLRQQERASAEAFQQNRATSLADARLMHERDVRHDSEWQSRLDSVRSQLASGGMVHVVAPQGDTDSCPSQDAASSSSQARRVKGPGDDFSGLSLEDVMMQGCRLANLRRRRSLGNHLARGSPGLLEWDVQNHCVQDEPDHGCSTSALGMHNTESPFGGLSLAEVLHRPARDDKQPQLQQEAEDDREQFRNVSQLRAENVDAWGGSSLAEVLASGAAARRAAQQSEQDTMLPPPPGSEPPRRNSGGRGARLRQQRNRSLAAQRDVGDSSSVRTPAVASVSARRPRWSLAEYRQLMRQPQRPPMRADQLQNLTGRAVLCLLEQFVYTKAAYVKRRNGGGGAEGDVHECSVCLEVFKQKQLVRRYCGCGHCYHEKCIDAWIARGDARCPLCRWDPVKEGW